MVELGDLDVSTNDYGVLKFDPDLSVPVPAGKKLYIVLYDPDNNDGTNIKSNTYEFEVEVYFAHAATSEG